MREDIHHMFGTFIAPKELTVSRQTPKYSLPMLSTSAASSRDV